MAKKLVTSYTFTPGASGVGTVVIAGTYALEQFLLVTNVTSNVIIYEFDVAALGGTLSTGGGNTTVTLDYDTSSMSSGDRLQIFIDDAAAPQTSLANIDADLGAQSDTAATSDTGTFSIISLFKRSLQSLTTLITNVPALSTNSGKLLVDGSSVLQPISDGGVLDALEADINAAKTGDGIGLLLQQDTIPDPQNPTGPAIQTTLRDPIQLDPSVPAIIGGIDPTGAAQRARVGTDGGLQLTDGKTFYGSSSGLNSTPTGWIDTTGYQSFTVTLLGAPTLTVTFQGTNDLGSTPTSVGGWLLVGSSLNVSAVANPSTGSTYQFPVTCRYFRVLVTAYTSGTISTVVVLRSTPAVYIPSSTVGAVIGGSSFGSATVAIKIDSLGNQQVAGSLPLGYQLNTYNPTYGRYTQTITSQTAAQSVVQPVIIGGLDNTSTSRGILLDNTAPNLGAVAITSAPSTPAQQSLHELLYQILATLRVIAHYEYDNGGRPPSDEPDNLIGEYLNQSNQFNNLTN